MDSAASILHALYRRLPVVVAVVLGALGAGVYYANRAPAEFVATASLIIPTEPPAMTLSSETGNLPKGPFIPDSAEDLRIGLLGVINAGSVHRRVYERLLEETGRKVSLSAIRKNIVGDIGRTGHVSLSAYGRSQKEAAALANLFLDEFEEELGSLAEQSVRQTLDALETYAPIAWQDFEQKNSELVALLGELGSSGLEDDARDLLEQRRQVDNRLFELSLRDAEARAVLPILERLISETAVEGEAPFVTTGRQLARNNAYQRALDQLQRAAVDLAKAREVYRDEHQQIKQLKVALEHAEERVRETAEEEMVLQAETLTLDEHTVALMNRLVDAQIAEAGFGPQREILEARAALIDAELNSLPQAFARESALKSQVVTSREFAESLSRLRAQLEFHLARGFDFAVTDEAFRATPESAKPVPSKAGIVIFSLLSGVIIGLMLALTLELIAQMRLRAPY